MSLSRKTDSQSKLDRKLQIVERLLYLIGACLTLVVVVNVGHLVGWW